MMVDQTSSFKESRIEDQSIRSSIVKETAEQIREKCKERMDNYRKDTKKEMPLSDQLDMRDP